MASGSQVALGQTRKEADRELCVPVCLFRIDDRLPNETIDLPK